MGRHLTMHLGGALVAVLVACAVPMLAVTLSARGGWLALAVAALAVPIVLVAFATKVVRWIRVPVAFRTPLTVGQQRSLPSLRHQATRAPHTPLQTLLRAILDIGLFRPLARTTPTARSLSNGLDHGTTRTLWLAAGLFHVSLAVILVRHLRMFLEPVPGFVAWLEDVDSLGEITLPRIHLSSVGFVLALLFLLGRRLWLARLRYISLAADYFPLLLLLAIASFGLVARHVVRTDVPMVKQVVTGLAGGTLALPSTPDLFLVGHLFLVAVLVVYFPLSKLMHAPGAWLSPTLTMANTNRERRHVNPNNPAVEVLQYADYEDAFRGPMIAAGLPVEKE